VFYSKFFKLSCDPITPYWFDQRRHNRSRVVKLGNPKTKRRAERLKAARPTNFSISMRHSAETDPVAWLSWTTPGSVWSKMGSAPTDFAGLRTPPNHTPGTYWSTQQEVREHDVGQLFDIPRPLRGTRLHGWRLQELVYTGGQGIGRGKRPDRK